MNVAVLGASDKPDRYSYQAVKLLSEKGHTVFPVNPMIMDIDGLTVSKQLSDIAVPIHTISVYLGPERSGPMVEAILRSQPQRVIFNPGAENPDLSQQLQMKGIEVLNACTLVLLKTNQFDRVGV